MKVTERPEPFWGMPSDDAEIEIGTKYGEPAVMVKGWIRWGSNASANCFLLTDPAEIKALGRALLAAAENISQNDTSGVSSCRTAT